MKLLKIVSQNIETDRLSHANVSRVSIDQYSSNSIVQVGYIFLNLINGIVVNVGALFLLSCFFFHFLLITDTVCGTVLNHDLLCLVLLSYFCALIDLFWGSDSPAFVSKASLESDRERERASEKEKEKSTGHSGTVKACGGGFNCALFIFLIYD